MNFEFRLSFPNVGSWNGKFSGESNYYAVVTKITDKQLQKRLIENDRYHYNDSYKLSNILN